MPQRNVGALPLVALLTVMLVAPARPAAAADSGADAPLLRVRDSRIVESSGLVASRLHPGVLWTVNDSSGAPVVYGVGEDGQTVAELELAGVTQRDWEALAPTTMPDGSPGLLVGDIGDNSGSRERGVVVYLVPEPAELGLVVARPARTYRLRYEDGPHDAEGLAVDPRSGRVYLVGKALFGAGVYAADRLSTSGDTVLRRVGRAPTLVTDAACLPDGRLVVRGYQSAQVLGRDLAREAGVDLPSQPQGESLAVTPDGSALLVGSEGEDSAVYRVPLPSDLPVASGDEPRGSVEVTRPAPPRVVESAPPVSEDGAGEGGSAAAAVLLAVAAGIVAALLLRTRALRHFLRRR